MRTSVDRHSVHPPARVTVASHRRPGRVWLITFAAAAAMLLAWPFAARAAAPEGVLTAVRAAAAAEASVQPADVTILRSEAVIWNDACLGVSAPEMFCAQVLTPGWVVWAQAGGSALRYHTDDAGSAVTLAASGITPADVATTPLPAGAEPRASGDLVSGNIATDGVTLFTITAQATPQALMQALQDRSCVATTLAITQGGQWRLYVPGAPAFVNAGFPLQFAAGHAFAVRCVPAVGLGGGFSTASVDHTGRSGMGVMSDVRMASHAGFDRIVFEFEPQFGDLILAAGVPSYRVQYTTAQPFTCGAGDPVTLEGTAILSVWFPDTYVYDLEAGVLTIPTRHFTDDLQVVREAREICAFEATAEWVIGIEGQRGFRISELSSPTRLVIDIQAN